MTDSPHSPPVRADWTRIRDRIGLLGSWSVWAVMTVMLLLYVRQYSRNIPYWDDFEMVPVVTGTQPVSLRWAWSQHNEHRPVISRLILAGLSRFISNDFRAPRYANVALLSSMAATMLWLARRLRGSARLTDIVLPLSILNVAQAESLMIGFAMNLILTSGLAIALIVAAGLTRPSNGRGTTVVFGLVLILLPLSGGSGLAMLPPLALWLAGYIACGWWSGAKPDTTTRLIGGGMLAACMVLCVLFLWDYNRPPYYPLPPSASAAASSTLLYLSLAVYPHLTSYWRTASAIVVVVLAATYLPLVVASVRSPGDRPRALALVAIILSMLCVACAVGVSRAGLGPGAILASRYVTITIPLLCVMYIAWLAYGRGRTRSVAQVMFLTMIALTLPDSRRFSREYGWKALVAQRHVERALVNRLPAAEVISRACPALYLDPALAEDRFRMLKVARMGSFVHFGEGRVGSSTEATNVLRR